MLSKITVILSFCLSLTAAEASRDARVVLSSLDTRCTADSDTQLQAAQTTVLYQSANCSVSSFTRAVEQIYIYSAKYVAKATEIVTEIGLHFTGCAVELVPLNVIMCVFKSILELPAEIGTLVQVSFQYFANILALVPPLISDIESCFTNSTENYQLALEDLVQTAKLCDARLSA